MVIRLGDDVHRIAASTFVYIPAGLAHCSWNEGPGPETHLEALIPATPPGAPIAFAVGSPNDVPPDQQAQQPATVVVDVGLSAEPTPRTSLIKLANPEMGIGRTVVNYADVAPGQGDLHTHVREVDEYYFVLEGQLTVDVGLHHHVVGPETLVVIPAGVPHRQYNEGPLVVKHLAILAPVPLDGEPWDREVHFGTNAL
jgi:mannose-6-phosphate isomerase-like protein (cupin superfamily)